ncbi:PEP/pyruvate-binding domain-containing protein [Aeromicrobium sp. Root344]|uniref:PEP/pyruvate-binding domain-containing protein n=1 Tax=Aeromicrobium sp. Root344 TaxID=1736521 RepID=UPI0012F88DC2|nr:PEP/pyruvate-binding domain-containing protein [Aeromicrobium sp. Root344]
MTLVDLGRAQADCGSKAHGLGRLLRSGAHVPPGFVVLDDPDPDEVAQAMARLTGPFAVRSSGLAEDTAAASFAGQLETVLGVVGVDQALAAIATCRASGRSSRARAYASRMQAPVESHVPVIVQQLVPADLAGVAFTQDPRSGARAVAIEAAWGLGESVVSGRVVPDAFTLVDGGEIETTTGSKATRLDHREGALRRTAVAAADRRRPVLSAEQAREVAEAALRAEAVHGTVVDVEWAIAGGTLWLLQVRPITGVIGPRERPEAPVGDAIVQGVGASPGRVSGRVRVVRDLDGFGAVEPGDVLVCRTTDPAWTPLFGIAAAVVTETGGALSHAAIVARELGIPAVVGADGARARLAGMEWVVVDGDHGTVSSAP